MQLNRRRFVLDALAATALTGIGRRANAFVYETRGFFTFEMLAVKHNPSNPMLAGVAEGRFTRYDKYPGDDKTIAYRVHHDARGGKIAYHPEYLDVLVYVWGSTRQGFERIRVADNPTGGERKDRAPSTVAPTYNAIPTLGTPDYIFNMKASKKVMMIAFPDEFFTAQTQVLLCAPGLRSIFPDSSKERGIWYHRGNLPWHRQQTTWTTTFFLVA